MERFMKRLLTVLFISAAFGATAQNQTIDPTVEVNRDYQGKMLETTKSRLSTAAADSLSQFNLNFNYSFFDKPYKDMYEFSAVPSASMPEEAPAARPSFVAKAGIGYPLAPEAAVWYSPQLKGNNYLDLNGNFNLFNGDVPAIAIDAANVEAVKSGGKARNKEYGYGVAGKYTHAWRSGELDIYGKFNGGYNTFYGALANNEGTAAYHRFNMVEGGICAKSSGAGKYGKKMNWAANGAFRHTSDKGSARLQENYGIFTGELGPTFGRYNKFMVGIEFEAVQYKGTAGYHMGIAGIVPQYRYENGNLKVNLGVKLQSKFSGNKDITGNHSWVFPAADLLFQLAKEKLWLYGKADGWNNLNTWSSLLEENRYVSPQYTPAGMMESSVPLNIEGGFKGRFTDKFSYRLYAAYTIHKGLQQFLYNCNEGYFLANYNSRHNETKVGGEIDVTTQKFRGKADIRYSSFSKDKDSEPVYGIPALQGNISVGYNWNGKVQADINCHLHGKYNFRYAYTGEPSQAGYYTAASATAPGFADLGASVGYVHSPALTFWLRGTNLLNSETQYLPLHIGRGVGISGGIIVKL